MHQFNEDDLSLWPYRDVYLLELLNGLYKIEDAREDLLSLVERRDNNESINGGQT